MIPSYAISDIIQVENKRVFYIGTFEDTPDPEIEWSHRHSFCSWVWFTQGEGINVIDFVEYPILSDRVFTMNPGQVHNWSYSKSTKGYIITFDSALAQQLQIDYPFSHFDIPNKDLILFKEVIKRGILEYNIEDEIGDYHTLACLSYLHTLGMRLARGRKFIHPLLTELHEEIAKDYSQYYTMSQLAERLSTTVEKLNSICKSHTGATLKQYQLDLKITEAKRLLIFARLNHSEIGYRLGFEDVSYFARLFRKRTGYSPTAFKEKYRNRQRES